MHDREQEHVQLEVFDAVPEGTEAVPARRVGENEWELVRTPLYAIGAATGDAVRVLSPASGRFEVTRWGGNVGVHFYLDEAHLNDAQATERTSEEITGLITPLGGRIDGSTPGLIVFTLAVGAGFPTIESLMERLVASNPGADWQYTNVYDRNTGDPIGWWE